MAKRRHFHAHETARQETLEGLLLASFGQRALGFLIDFVIVVVFWIPCEFVWRRYLLHQVKIDLHFDFHELGNVVAVVLYFALASYLSNGRSVGKWITRTRVLSLTHNDMGLWQSVERALGYGASFLEAGFGFVQYFMQRNRQCVHDRIAETIVVDVRKRAKG